MRMYIHEMSRMLALPHGAAETGADRLRAAGRDHRVPGQERREVRRHADRAHAGPPPPCGMQNVLCRLRWQTSAPMSPGPAEPDLRVHVRAVHVDLAAVLVDDRRRSRVIASSNTPCVDG